jgi:hypothetical protein
VPADLTEAALAAFALRALDAELARLTFDSLVEGAGAVRGPDAARVLAFTAGDVTVELELDGPRLTGQLLPAAPAEIEVRLGARTLTVTADALGRFTAAPVEPGPLSLRCRLDAGRTLVTDWILTR